ncbi:MAG: hypothetical protein HRT70_08815 [Flavobacteriaceae bacterium]|nr:hypothetical protein [Flavobacteriaceae bacterium]
MNYPKYQYKSERKFLHFEFISEGAKGLIPKIVEYTETEQTNIYNLGFGDYDKKTKSINDLSITNNGDSLKVLATVASTVYAFTEKYPKAWIFATGSTNARTRLYRMGITNNLAEIQKDFKVFGLTIENNVWEEFIAGEDYNAFLITKKENYGN